MVTHVRTVAFQGVDVLPIDVQVHMAAGVPAFTIVGLPDKAVAESRERVRAALGAMGLSLPACCRRTGWCGSGRFATRITRPRWWR